MVLETYVNKVIRSIYKPRSANKSLLTCADIEDVYAGVLNWVKGRLGDDFFAKAKEEFFSSYGKVFPDDEIYQDWMNYFLDWLLYERVTLELGQNTTIIEQLPIDFSAQILGESKSVLEFMKQRSSIVFEVIFSNDTEVFGRDLLTQSKIFIFARSGQNLKFMQTGSIIQAWLIGDSNHRWFGQGMIIHSPKIRSFLKKAKNT